MNRLPLISIAALLLLIASGRGVAAYGRNFPVRTASEHAAGNLMSPDEYYIYEGDTLFRRFIPPIPVEQEHSGPLTDDDIRAMADSLGVETAAIKAVIDIETGKNHVGFHTDGRPLVNFDLGMFKRRAQRDGVNLAAAAAQYPATFEAPDIPRYGSHQDAHYARLDGALAIDSIAAIESTFWGMFQIGGFNWKLAGATDHQDFVRRVSRSEYDQLVLFANFMRNTGLLTHLKNKNWTAFARLYNGPGYASRGYHTRLAASYARHKAQERREAAAESAGTRPPRLPAAK